MRLSVVLTNMVNRHDRIAGLAFGDELNNNQIMTLRDPGKLA
jgi:hypothetical protein